MDCYFELQTYNDFEMHNISNILIRQTSSSVSHLSHSYLDAGIKGNADNEGTTVAH